MSTKGKTEIEAIKKIIERHRKIKRKLQANSEQYEKSKKAVLGRVAKFPKAELPLYQEKINKLLKNL
jgi:hypothetical protein